MHDSIRDFFGFKSMPFSKPVATNDLFETNDIKDLHYKMGIAIQNEDFVLVTGAPGSGKSSAIRKFVATLDERMYPCVYITAERYKIGDVAKLLMTGLTGSSPFHGYVALRTVKNEITRLYGEKNQRPILIIDEAQDLPSETLSSVKNLVNFDIDSRSKMLVVLCGQFELISKIRMAQLESLRRRIRIQVKMSPMSIEECSRYITHHMKCAGIERKIFSDELVAGIFQMSQGIVSNVNNICFELIVSAASEKKEIIDSGMLEKVIRPS